MLARLFGSALHGVEAFRVTIEVSVDNGAGYFISGQPDDAVKESLSRIDVAIKRNGFHMPRTKISINLAPADVRKTGTAYDLPIALGILIASEQLFDISKLNDYLIAGEIGLDGSIYPVRGALCMAHLAKEQKLKGIIIPAANAKEASLIDSVEVYGVSHIKDIISFVQSDIALQPYKSCYSSKTNRSSLDLKDVKGQQHVKRALEIAAAGGHNSILVGPPGNGKTMMAKRLPSILPPMTLVESLETTRIYSVVGNGEPLTGLITERPFRNPHHTASDVALIGGGSIPVPGEVSLAHNGVLFLDELYEFKRAAIEALRQPLEDRKVLISRAKMALEYPSSFMLLAAANPCFCGHHGNSLRACSCSKRALYFYRRKLSGPLLERIDLQIEMESVPMEELMNMQPGESSVTILKRVIKARNRQLKRFSELEGVHSNAMIPDHDIEVFCLLESSARRFLFYAMDTYQLSARSYSRILKVARTIADLAGTDIIALEHVAEAVHLRSLDKPLETTIVKNTKKKNHEQPEISI